MKRKVDENLPRWEKISGGTLYLSVRGNHRIKPGEKIRCTAEEIHRTMPDATGVFHFKLIEEGKGEFKLSKKAKKKAAKLAAAEKKVGNTIPDKDTYTVVHIKGGWHNVKSSTKHLPILFHLILLFTLGREPRVGNRMKLLTYHLLLPNLLIRL